VKSVRIALATELNEGVHLVQPAGQAVDHHRTMLVAYGPVSSSVLESLRRVGVRELNSEAEHLLLRNGRLDGDEAVLDHLPQDAFERGLEIWRASALWSRIAEDLAALVRAIRRWRAAGCPRYLDCQIGRDYLQWVPSPNDSVLGMFEAMSSPDDVRAALLLPDPELVVPLIGTQQAELVEAACSRTAIDVSAWFGDMCSTLTAETQRTFARWKHRVAATSPGLVPLWLRGTEAERVQEVETGFREGFSIIDWSPQKTALPELIVWTGEPMDFARFVQAALHGIEMLGTFVEGLLRFANADLPIIPWRSWTSPTPEVTNAMEALNQTSYRITALEALRSSIRGGR
jgi:hypothetical protein